MCSRNGSSAGSPFGVGFGGASNKYRSEDIMSCISALDEVIAEFDDPSLPYIYEDYDSSLAQQTASNSSQEVPSTSSTNPKHFSTESKLVLRNERDENQMSGINSWGDKKSSKSPSQSPLLGKPVSCGGLSKSTTTAAAAVKAISAEKVVTSAEAAPVLTPPALSSKLPSKPSVVPRTGSSDTGKVSNKSSEGGGGGACGGTYSKGTNYEILLPRIASSSEQHLQQQSSSSSRNQQHVPSEPIYSSIGKSRPQLSLGVYTSHHGHSRPPPPQEPEIDYEENNVYNGNDYNVQKRFSAPPSGGGKLAKSASSSGATPTASTSPPGNEMTKELWNFPSEKNLPRSLRKTRKTCFLEDVNGQGEKCGEGRKNSSEVPGSVGQQGSGASGHSSTGSSSSSKYGQDVHPGNVKAVKKIYEDIVVISSNNAKANNNHHLNHKGGNGKGSCEGNSPPLSSSSSMSFNSFSNSSSLAEPTPPPPPAAPMPKPRVRQQIPTVDDNCSVKYPPGKIPKPNPKPGSVTGGVVNQIEVEGASSPFSPVPCGETRTEDDEGQVVVVKGINENVTPKNLNNNGALSSSTTTNNGHMMRMMMMMKPSSAKNNSSTGSASSISRSSSSSSGGDPNYYRKDNLSASSSSGVVVTTNSSTTTASPTHSVNNNSLNNNNNITIINTEQVAEEEEEEVKGQGRQRTMAQLLPVGIGSKSGGCQVQHLGPNNIVLTTGNGCGGVLDVDDGYLSMINRNEAPLLWPEEFIENETFSPDELKRLSVHLPEEEDTSPSDSESDKEIELEIVDYEREPSRRQPQHGHNRSRKQHGSSLGPKKTEYFSDDSLEGEREDGFLQHKSVSPYLYSPSSPPKTRGAVGGGGGGVPSFVSASPQNLYYRQQISVNTAFVQPTKGQVSRIPKKISSSNATKKKGEPQQQQATRKPCSFFVSLTDGGGGRRGGGPSTEVNSTEKSSSLPMGSKLAISPVKQSLREKSEPEPAPTLQVVDSDSKATNPNDNVVKPNKGSNLPQPQLRHTKSINTGGPIRSSANANKRKSTSDLVTVVTLNNHQDIKNNTDPNTALPPPPLVTTSFNRTSTFLIPSPCSRSAEGRVTGQKRPRDDETDNDEDDFSSDLFLNPTEPDSLQPLSLTDVHDFVSEIMDTALRQEIKRTQMTLNNYPLDGLDGSSTSTTNQTQKNQLICQDSSPITPQVKNTYLQKGLEEVANLPHAQEATQQQQQEQKSSQVMSCSPCDNEEEGKVNGDERARVAEQLEAVVSNFLSDNQSFLVQGDEGNVNEEGGQEADTSDEKKNAATSSCHEQGSDEAAGGQVVVLVQSEEIVDNRVPVPVGDQALDGTTVPLSKADDDIVPKDTQPLMNSTNSKSYGHEVTASGSGSTSALRDSSLVGEEKILDHESEEEDSEEQPPQFIPTPPPHLISPPEVTATTTPTPTPLSAPVLPTPPLQTNFYFRPNGNGGNVHNFHNSNAREGKAALDILAERINNNKKFIGDEQLLPVSHFIHDKRNIWAMYDRPFDEDMLTVNHGVRGYASRSQENLMDAMTKERFTKSFSGRGQSSTLPLNCRPPSTQRRSSTFRNMFNKFRKSKPSAGPTIKEIPEYHDDEIQSITSRETGPSEQGKKRGFFSRLFRRSRKH